MEGIETLKKHWPNVGRIDFHRKHKTHSVLSNMEPSGIAFPDITYNDKVLVDAGSALSVENVFQAAKAAFVQKREKSARIIASLKPEKCKGMAGATNMPMSAEEIVAWEHASTDVMLQILWAKFASPDLASILKSTGDAVLVEKVPRCGDTKWGVDNSDFGANLLGKMLMHIRLTC
jgi:ribA/ribD-fused uncharacterized protein